MDGDLDLTKKFLLVLQIHRLRSDAWSAMVGLLPRLQYIRWNRKRKEIAAIWII